MAQQHEWMTDGITLEKSEAMLAEYEREGWQIVSLSWDSEGGCFMGCWKRPKTAITVNVLKPLPDDVYGAVGRLRAWIKEFGPHKQPEFISDLKTVLAVIVNAE